MVSLKQDPRVLPDREEDLVHVGMPRQKIGDVQQHVSSDVSVTGVCGVDGGLRLGRAAVRGSSKREMAGGGSGQGRLELVPVVHGGGTHDDMGTEDVSNLWLGG